MVSMGQEMVRGKSGNFKYFFESGKISSLKEVREKGSFKTTYMYSFIFPLLLLFSNIFKSFVHFTDMNHVVLVGYFH